MRYLLLVSSVLKVALLCLLLVSAARADTIEITTGQINVTAVPELDSLALSLAGMTGLGCFGFSRRWRPL